MRIHNFIDIISNKSILYIPIVSCINRDTNEYNLSADGNVNRFITTFSIANSYKDLTILLPKKHIINSEKIVEDFSKYNRTKLFYLDDFGIHAGEQRNNINVVNSVIDFIIRLNKDFDYIIFESQLLGINLSKIIKTNYIFWNPVSKINDIKTRSFLEGYEELNQQCIDLSKYMIIASPDQLRYYEQYNNKLIYIDKLIDRDLSYFNYTCNDILRLNINNWISQGKDVFYLPFRLSDQGYKIDEVIKFINNKSNNYIVLYSDPNNCHLMDNNNWIKVSTNRDTYYTIIDTEGVQIPYFEDIEFINHAAIHEFLNKKCKATIYVMNQNNNPYNINKCNRFIKL